MGPRVIYYGEHGEARTLRALELAPADLDWAVVSPEDDAGERDAAMADAEAIITSGASIPMDVLQKMPRMRLLQVMSAGFDRIEVPAIREMGIEVCNNSPAIASSVAEHAVTLMLAVYKRFTQAVEGVHDGAWQGHAKTGPHGRVYELTGRTVGIVGLGNIGSRVAKMLQGFDTETLYHDVRSISPEEEQRLKVTRVSFEELLERSDIVTAHVPLYSATRGMFGAAEFRAMQPHAIFINTCRGPVHDEKALIDALQSGVIAAAGLDVTEIEPTPLDSPLQKMENVVLTPHLAGSSQERVDRALVFSFENARRVLNGEKPLNAVEVLD